MFEENKNSTENTLLLENSTLDDTTQPEAQTITNFNDPQSSTSGSIISLYSKDILSVLELKKIVDVNVEKLKLLHHFYIKKIFSDR